MHDVATLNFGVAVQDVVTFKMLLRLRCCYECFQDDVVDVEREKAHVHFAHGSLVDHDNDQN